MLRKAYIRAARATLVSEFKKSTVHVRRACRLDRGAFAGCVLGSNSDESWDLELLSFWAEPVPFMGNVTKQPKPCQALILHGSGFPFSV